METTSTKHNGCMPSRMAQNKTDQNKCWQRDEETGVGYVRWCNHLEKDLVVSQSGNCRVTTHPRSSGINPRELETYVYSKTCKYS
jgi:hypothetical protein